MAGHTTVKGVSACFKGDSGEDLVVHGAVTLPPVLTHNCEYEAMPVAVTVDDPSRGNPDLDRDLTEAEELKALEAMFQAACDKVRN